MPSDIQFQDDAFAPITSVNFGAVNAGESVVVKIYIVNEGSTGISSAILSLESVASSDGVNYVSMAFDGGGGNPGAYQTADKFIGDIDAGEQYPVWLKAAPSASITPAGNPRVFDLIIEYTAT